EKKKSDFCKILEAHDDIVLPQPGDLIDSQIIAIGKNEVILDYKGIMSGVVRGKEAQDEIGGSDYKVGDIVSATVLELDNEKGYMELSFRYASHQKAWEELEKLMKDEEIVEAKVFDANKGGLMVKVGNITGFLPVSQLTTKYYPRVEGGDKHKILNHLKSFVNEIFKTTIIDVDEKENKLIVSQKSAWADDQKKSLKEYKVGKVIEGRITGVANFGAFIEFGDNLEGLVHISEIAWQRIDNPNDVVKVGDNVKAEIISVDGGRISLSMKRLKGDPWADITKKYEIGQKIKGLVLKINPFGAFVELDKDIHGLAHISELSDRIINSPEDVVKIGEEYEFTIDNLEPKQHRLGLSLKKSSKTKKESVDKKEVTDESSRDEKKDKNTEKEADKKESKEVEKDSKKKEDTKSKKEDTSKKELKKKKESKSKKKEDKK
ncbi:S1 RNA-binding domain-containing protein, partial [bacterium]|nr:S1 RNA-binding domain-containing protein [bacterium]